MEKSLGKHRRPLRRRNWAQHSHDESSVLRAIEKRDVRLELREELEPGRACPKCGSETCAAVLLDVDDYESPVLYYLGVEVPYTTSTGDPSVLPRYDRIDDI